MSMAMTNTSATANFESEIRFSTGVIGGLLLLSLAFASSVLLWWFTTKSLVRPSIRAIYFDPKTVISSYFAAFFYLFAALSPLVRGIVRAGQRVVNFVAQRPVTAIVSLALFFFLAFLGIILPTLLAVVNTGLVAFRPLFVGLSYIFGVFVYVYEAFIPFVNYFGVRLPTEAVTALLFDSATCGAAASLNLGQGFTEFFSGIVTGYRDWTLNSNLLDQRADFTAAALGLVQFLEAIPAFLTCVCSSLGMLLEPLFEALREPPPSNPSVEAGFLTATKAVLNIPPDIFLTVGRALPFGSYQTYFVFGLTIQELFRGFFGIPGNIIVSYYSNFFGVPIDNVLNLTGHRDAKLPRVMSWHRHAQFIPFAAGPLPRLANEPMSCDNLTFLDCDPTCAGFTTMTACEMNTGCYFDNMTNVCERCSTCDALTTFPTLDVNTSIVADFRFLSSPGIGLATRSLDFVSFRRLLTGNGRQFNRIGFNAFSTFFTLADIILAGVNSVLSLFVGDFSAGLFSYDGRVVWFFDTYIQTLNRLVIGISDFFRSLADIFLFTANLLDSGDGTSGSCANVQINAVGVGQCIYGIVGSIIRLPFDFFTPLLVSWERFPFLVYEWFIGTIYYVTTQATNSITCSGPGSTPGSQFCEVPFVDFVLDYAKWQNGQRLRPNASSPIYCPRELCNLPECTTNADCEPYKFGGIPPLCSGMYGRCVATSSECASMTTADEQFLLPSSCLVQNNNDCSVGICMKGGVSNMCTDVLADDFTCNCICAPNEYREVTQGFVDALNGFGNFFVNILGPQANSIPCFFQNLGALLVEFAYLVIDVVLNIVSIALGEHTIDTDPVVYRASGVLYCLLDGLRDLVAYIISTASDTGRLNALAFYGDCLRKAATTFAQAILRLGRLVYQNDVVVTRPVMDFFDAFTALVAALLEALGALIGLFGIVFDLIFPGILSIFTEVGDAIKDEAFVIATAIIDVFEFIITCGLGFLQFFLGILQLGSDGSVNTIIDALESIADCIIQVLAALISIILEPIICVLNAAACFFPGLNPFPFMDLGIPSMCLLFPGSGFTRCAELNPFCIAGKSLCDVSLGPIDFDFLNDEVFVPLFNCDRCSNILEGCAPAEDQCRDVTRADCFPRFVADPSIVDPLTTLPCFFIEYQSQDNFLDDDDSSNDGSSVGCCFDENDAWVRNTTTGCAAKRYAPIYYTPDDCVVRFFAGGACYSLLDGFESCLNEIPPQYTGIIEVPGDIEGRNLDECFAGNITCPLAGNPITFNRTVGIGRWALFLSNFDFANDDVEVILTYQNNDLQLQSHSGNTTMLMTDTTPVASPHTPSTFLSPYYPDIGSMTRFAEDKTCRILLQSLPKRESWPPLQRVVDLNNAGQHAQAHTLAQCIDAATWKRAMPDAPFVRTFLQTVLPLASVLHLNADQATRMHAAYERDRASGRLQLAADEELPLTQRYHTYKKEPRGPLALSLHYAKQTERAVVPLQLLNANIGRGIARELERNHRRYNAMRSLISCVRRIAQAGVAAVRARGAVSDARLPYAHPVTRSRAERARVENRTYARPTVFAELEQRRNPVRTSTTFSATQASAHVQRMHRLTHQFRDRLVDVEPQRMAQRALQHSTAPVVQQTTTPALTNVGGISLENECRSNESPFECCDDQSVCLDCSYVDRIAFGVEDTLINALNYYDGDFVDRFGECRERAYLTNMYELPAPGLEMPAPICALPPCSDDDQCKRSFNDSRATCVTQLERCIIGDVLPTNSCVEPGATCIVPVNITSMSPLEFPLFDFGNCSVGGMCTVTSGTLDVRRQCPLQYGMPTKRVPSILRRFLTINTPLTWDYDAFLSRLSPHETLFPAVNMTVATGRYDTAYDCANPNTTNFNCDVPSLLGRTPDGSGAGDMIVEFIDNTSFMVENLNQSSSEDVVTRFLYEYILCDYNTSYYCYLDGPRDPYCCSDTCEDRQLGTSLFDGLVLLLLIPLIFSCISAQACFGLSIGTFVFIAIFAFYTPLAFWVAYGGQLFCYIGATFLATVFFGFGTVVCCRRCCTCCCRTSCELCVAPPFVRRLLTGLFRFLLAIGLALSVFAGSPVCLGFDLATYFNELVPPCGLGFEAFIDRNGVIEVTACSPDLVPTYLSCINSPLLTETQFDDGLDSALYYCEEFFPTCSNAIQTTFDNVTALDFLVERAALHEAEDHLRERSFVESCALLFTGQLSAILLLTAFLAIVLAPLLLGVLSSILFTLLPIGGWLQAAAEAWSQTEKMLLRDTEADFEEQEALTTQGMSTYF